MAVCAARHGGVNVAELTPDSSLFDRHRAETWRAIAHASPDRRFEALLLASTSIVWWTNPEGEFVERQPYWEAYTGQSWEQYRGSGWTSTLHPDDSASIMSDWGAALVRGSTYVTQGRVWSVRHGGYRAFQMRGIPIRNEDGWIEEWLGALTDVQDTIDLTTRLRWAETDLTNTLKSLRLSEASFRESEERYRLLVDLAPDGIFVSSLDGRYRDVNPAGCAMLRLSKDEILSTSFFEFLAPEEHARVPAEMNKVASGGIARSEWRFIRRDKSVFFAEILGRQLPNGSLQAVARDVTDRRQKDEHNRLLNQEINHRNKNLLSIVNAIARRTAATDIAEYRTRLSERLRALSQSNDLLLNADWKGVPLADLIASQMAHFSDGAGNRIAFAGPDLLISASAAQMLGMAFHELATNALKHGALSTDAGRVAIAWEISNMPEGESLCLSWIERDGPAVRPNRHPGFGSALLRELRSALNAHAELRFSPGGAEWRAEIPTAGIKAVP